jgi:hypothetical protein
MVCMGDIGWLHGGSKCPYVVRMWGYGVDIVLSGTVVVLSVT